MHCFIFQHLEGVAPPSWLDKAVIPGGPWMEPSGKVLLKQIYSCLMTRTVKLFTGHLRCWQPVAADLHTAFVSQRFQTETGRDDPDTQTDKRARVKAYKAVDRKTTSWCVWVKTTGSENRARSLCSMHGKAIRDFDLCWPFGASLEEAVTKTGRIFKDV